MKVTLRPPTLELPESLGRTKGTHLSSVIRCLATDMGILNNEQAEELNLMDVKYVVDPVALLRIMIGLAWEDWYLKNVLVLDGVEKHPGEFKLDSIYMTPDGLSEEGVDSVDTFLTQRTSKNDVKYVRVHELKATYKSTRTVGETVQELQKQWMWMAQIKGYCHAAGTNYASLHVLFLCGNYRMPIRPVLRVYELEFTSAELQENWDIIVEGRDYYGE
jgi:hypothetical protein